ncbi:MAG: L-lactate dehydrogenase complex protein LldG [Chthoniobacter sp.]|jgi:L-lactate dehydrogenase complex protein LldG|nr:L-lactate dehydrogenase complex protein LldG [Chthoniobacter sp.]
MSEREKILGSIREALAVNAPLPGAHDHHAPAVLRHRDDDVSQWLPAVGQTFEQRVERFHANALDLRADFHLLNTVQEMGAKLLEIRDGENWQKIGTHRGELTDAVSAELGLPTIRTDDGYDVRELESCDAGISECDALVAQTGSVVVSNRSAGGRALSVLPPHHVVLARREQLVRDLPAAFILLKHRYAPVFPSFFSFITGPSRTGDIERILVLGAHGPKKLTILCV